MSHALPQFLGASDSASNLPILFLSHGSPMLAVDPGPAGEAMQKLGQRLSSTDVFQTSPRPIILAISPHWVSDTLRISGRNQQLAWHDFGGFPPALYQLEYAPKGAPDLATQLVQALNEAGETAAVDTDRALDHGAWVPLSHLFPRANVPVVQLSVRSQDSPVQQFMLGMLLAKLMNQPSVLNRPVLVMATGSFTHNLPETFALLRKGVLQHGMVALPQVKAFQRWMDVALDEGVMALANGEAPLRAFSALLDYRAQAPYAHWAHPEEEHLLPFFLALGIAAVRYSGNMLPIEKLTDSVCYGTLAMDSFLFGELPG